MEDLDIDLEIISSDFDHMRTLRQAEEVAARPKHPDYLITGNEKGIGGEIIRIADQAGIPVFLFSNGFVSSRDIQQYGHPRERFTNWIGELIPNNYSAGYTMGKTLLDSAEALHLRAADGTVKVVAIGGTHKTHASDERLRGLAEAMLDHPSPASLLQIVHGNWTFEDGKRLGGGLLARYDDIQIVWGANDSIALGAMTEAVARGKVPGKDILFGGCGWYLPALQHIKSGEFTTSVGGHFMEGGWALIMLYDYHHGIDFATDPWQTRMFSIDHDNVDTYLPIFTNQTWGTIDFTRYSKAKNLHLKNYDFSLDTLARQLAPEPGRLQPPERIQ